jgi:hypothetical protein
MGVSPGKLIAARISLYGIRMPTEPLSPEDRAVIIEAIAAALLESYNFDQAASGSDEERSELGPADEYIVC